MYLAQGRRERRAAVTAAKPSGISAFAEAQLRKFGWQKGQGLGKNRDGITRAVSLRWKDDQKGIGASLGENIGTMWWDKVFNEASAALTTSVVTGDGGGDGNGTVAAASASASMRTAASVPVAFVQGAGLGAGRSNDSSDSSDSSDDSSDDDEARSIRRSLVRPVIGAPTPPQQPSPVLTPQAFVRAAAPTTATLAQFTSAETLTSDDVTAVRMTSAQSMARIVRSVDLPDHEADPRARGHRDTMHMYEHRCTGKLARVQRQEQLFREKMAARAAAESAAAASPSPGPSSSSAQKRARASDTDGADAGASSAKRRKSDPCNDADAAARAARKAARAERRARKAARAERRAAKEAKKQRKEARKASKRKASSK